MYQEHDYASGSALLTLRTAIGLTQAGLASELGVSRHAVWAWETGESHPKTEHLKALVALGREHGAFHNPVEEVRALWKVTRQKEQLDEQWLSEPTAKSSIYDQQMAAWYAYLEQS